MSKRKKPDAKDVLVPVPKDQLLELRAESAALWKLLSEGGDACLWNALTDQIYAAINRLDTDPHDRGSAEATGAIAIRGLVDALFALECAVRDIKEHTLDQYDHEGKAGKAVARAAK